MIECATIEPHLAVTPLLSGGKDVFKNAYQPWIPPEGLRAIFGGFLLAQSISAAQSTLSTNFTVHSPQSFFLRPGNATNDIVYHVERITDGRAFATRLVRVVQAKVDIFIATIGFQKTDARASERSRSIGGILQYGIAPPDLGGVKPEDLRDTSSNSQREMLLNMGWPQYMIDNAPADPFEWLHFACEKTHDSPTQFRLRSFVRSTSRLSTDSSAIHLSALAFLTDEFLLGIPSLADPKAVSEKSMNIAVQATISHSIVFHSSIARADEWLVCERDTSWAAEGRVLVNQRIWSYSTGQLVLTCHSEGLIRLRKAKL